MRTLFVEKKAMELRYERSCLLLYHEGKRISSVPLVQINRIVVAPHVTLAAGVLGLVAEKEVALLVINSRYPERTALLSGTIKGDVKRRLAQYHLCQDLEVRLYWSFFLIKLKISRQYRLLKYLAKKRPECRHELQKSMQSLNVMLSEMTSVSTITSLASLRGKEGAAAALFFRAYTQVFPVHLKFHGRNRRPPKDPVNVCLSISYTLCYQEAVNALKTYGLDSTLGCFHDLSYSRDSLACDLIEPIRPFLEAWVYQLFNKKIIRLEDFKCSDICILQAAGKKRFYTAFRSKSSAIRTLLRAYARYTVKVIAHYGQPFN